MVEPELCVSRAGAESPPSPFPPRPQDSGGWTPIIWAAEHKHIEVIRMLLTRGADVTLTDNVSEGLVGMLEVGSVLPCA